MQIIIQAFNDVSLIESDKPTYTFKNLEDNATYKIYSYGIDKNKIKTNMYETEITTNSYNVAKINSVTHTSTLNSITLNVNAQKGDNEIEKYFYSKDNGATYVESTSSIYTFNNLTDTTEYKIKVKVLDSYGRYSTEYLEAIATTTYILPNVTKVTPTTKYNQITVTTTGTKGTNEISKYYYSINNSSYVQGSSTYTFTNLNEQTTYTIKVKVADTNGRMSNEYSLSATTDAYKLPTITNVTTSSTSDTITINVSGQNGTGAITEYYYSKDNGSNYVKSTSSSYTFTNLTSNTTYYIKVYAKDNNGRISSVFTTNLATKSSFLTDYVISQYTGTQSNNGLYYHNSTLANGAGDNSYRYAGANPNNFVCFGSDASPCPTDNLYRIIGVIDGKVKLIKYDYATSALLGTAWDYISDYHSPSQPYKGNLLLINTYTWNNKTRKNIWSESILNQTNLNTNFINNIGTTWANKIATTTWKVGGNTYENIIKVVPATAYQNEVGSSASSTTYDAKIGLMYVSDYYYSASSSSWTLVGYNERDATKDYRAATSTNWMYMGFNEWTISRYQGISNRAFFLFSTGYVIDEYVYKYDTSGFGVRPVFFLEPSVTYASGTGTSNDPIRINL